MARLDKKYLEFLQGAKQSYIEYCESLPEAIRRQKMVDKNIRYYDMLEDFYSGKSIKEVAAKNEMHPHSLRNTLAETQYRVSIFAKEI
jgi:hypothetical protein